MVEETRGDATLLRGGQRFPLAAGVGLLAQDRLVTGAGGRIGIACADGIVVTVGDSATLDLARLPRGSDRSMVLELLDGIARFVLPERRPAGRFEVITPSAVASVRSTDWLAEASGGDRAAVFVLRGVVAVAARGRDGEVELTAGEGVDADAGGLREVRRWPDGRVQAALARLAL